MNKEARSAAKLLSILAKKAPEFTKQFLKETSSNLSRYLKNEKFKLPSDITALATNKLEDITPAKLMQDKGLRSLASRDYTYDVNSPAVRSYLQRKGLATKPIINSSVENPVVIPGRDVDNRLRLLTREHSLLGGLIGEYLPNPNLTKLLVTPHYVESPIKEPEYASALLGDSQALKHFSAINWPNSKPRLIIEPQAYVRNPHSVQEGEVVMRDIIENNKLQTDASNAAYAYDRINHTRTAPKITQESKHYETVLPTQFVHRLNRIFAPVYPGTEGAINLQTLLQQGGGNRLYHGGRNTVGSVNGLQEIWDTHNPAVAWAALNNSGLRSSMRHAQNDLLNNSWVKDIKDLISPEEYDRLMLEIADTQAKGYFAGIAKYLGQSI